MNQLQALLLFVLWVIAAGCAESAPENSWSEGKAGQAEKRQAGFLLPVSLNEVMVALVNESADPLWVAAWKNPRSDQDWRELERRAYQLELAGTLIAFPGTGALDKTWTIKRSWRDWSAQLRDTGRDAIVAVQARDIGEISSIGDRLVAVCEGCHSEFKPAMPTGGKYGELSQPPSAVVVYDGRALYASNCSNCHGVYGEGDGIVSPSLAVALRDLRYLAKNNAGVFPGTFVTRIIDGRDTRVAHGPAGMPVWGSVFAGQEGVDRAAETRVSEKVDALVDFLESMQISQ